ncbi:MAG: aminotransferase class I/II-fold pyridoxal phosphate-dependent enzyme [Bacteroidales bacterium]|nr:8-amino-7-oxononanoate synthase [Bacteroidota bacterium]MBR6063346.1 aminotransferase class I/II-fold pyridoxal phosphate-dependent enzyme [Bacteroidales bacterium]
MKNHLLQNKCAQYRAPQIAKANGIYPYYKEIESEQSTVVKIDGKDVLMFSSNSYLGLSNDPRLKEAAKAAIDKYGTSCSGSRFLNGTLDIHVELEDKLARLVGKDGALCFSTGFQVNLGVVSALCGRNDYLLLDRLNHASIIEGSRLAFGKSLKYAHNDMESLEKCLQQCEPESVKLIVADGVFSMEGDIVSLPEMVALAEKYDAEIMLDDAHSLGVLGHQGRGTADHFGLTDKVDLIMGTFSKSFGSLGGFIASDADTINYLKHNARSLIFSASMPPSNVAAVSRAIDIMLDEPERIQHLWDVSNYARKQFQERGFDTGRSETPIIPLFVRNSEKAFWLCSRLLEDGVFVTPVIAPAVPEDDVLIRFALMATHSFGQVDEAIDKITKAFKNAKIL